MNQLGHFERELLIELRQVVAEQAEGPQPRRALPGLRIALTTAGGGLLAAGLLVVPSTLEGDQTPAAYAVVPNDNGTVTVRVERLEDSKGLEDQLAAHGVRADIDWAPPGMMCRPDPSRPGSEPSPGVVGGIVTNEVGESFEMTVNPSALDGATLVLEHGHRTRTTEQDGMVTVSSETSFTIGVATGPVAPCELVAAGE